VSPLQLLQRTPLLSQPPLAIAVDVVVFLCVLLIALAVIADFRNYYRQDRGVEKADRSWVETGSMTLFFVLYFVVVRAGLMRVPLPAAWRTGLLILGLALMIFGAGFNVLGRLYLSSNWANQIRIYSGHYLVTTGPFAVVRHPLYASLIWMFVGGALVYANAAALLLTLGVFVPMMYVRATKEDALLGEAFGDEFDAYRSRTGMLLPSPPRGQL
jgi:protein-S-isoprenylcysteine O-methyltransferase Ste14